MSASDKPVAGPYFLDANIFLRFLVRDNEKTFQDCQHFLELVRQGNVEALTSIGVLIEVNYVLISFYGLPKTQVITALKSITGLNSLRIVDKFNLPTALEFYQESRAKLVDCLIAGIDEVAKGLWTVVSYDKDFDRLKVKRREPKDITTNLKAFHSKKRRP